MKADAGGTGTVASLNREVEKWRSGKVKKWRKWRKWRK
jgi:hypothetical protein